MGNESQAEATKISKDILKLALEAMKGAPWQARLIIAAQGALILLLLFAAAVVFIGNALYGLIAIIIGVIPTLLVLWYMLNALKRAMPRVTWAREYIDNERAEQSFERLGKSLEEFRLKAADIVRRVSGKDVPADNIRTNIFIPDCTDTQDGHLFRLYMPTPLRRNMEYPAEWDIKFRPGQGCAGTCFLEGVKRIVTTKDFRVGDEFINRINPELKWIISLPVKRGSKYTIAVLNVDGLGVEIEKSILEKIAAELKDEFGKIEKEMNRLKLAKLFTEVAVA